MAKVFFKIAPPLDEAKERLAKLGIAVGQIQSEFLKKHESHRGVTVDNGKVSCRTCNVST